MSSDEGFEVKMQIVDASVESVAHDANACGSLLQLFFEWSLNDDDPIKVAIARVQIKKMASRSESTFLEATNPSWLLSLFNSDASNTVRRVNLVSIVLSTLKEMRSEMAQVNLRALINVARGYIHSIWEQQGWDLDVSLAVSRIYGRHPSLLPRSGHTKLSTHVVKILGAAKRPEHLKMEEFEAVCEEISGILTLIFGSTTERETVEQCLIKVHDLASNQAELAPGPALLFVLDKIPSPFMEAAMEQMLELSESDEDRSVTSLRNMVEWLCSIKTKRQECLCNWMLGILRGLLERSKISVLIEIAFGTVERLMRAYADVRLMNGVEPILFFLLLGFQHSESVFHGVLFLMPQLIRDLHSKNLRQCVERLGEAVAFLMAKFPGTDELYGPLKESLSEVNVPSVPEERVKELQSLAWLASVRSTSSGSNNNKHKAASFIDESLISRSETGLLGLMNLGNTCFMNAVIQGLFMSTEFCEEVLYAPVSECDHVLVKLQLAFAHLRFSERSLFSPSAFLEASKPPWFETGRQHDCSEYLRYLLDTLHEQERSGRQTGGNFSKELQNQNEEQKKAIQEQKQVKATATLVTVDETAIKPSTSDCLEDENMSQEWAEDESVEEEDQGARKFASRGSHASLSTCLHRWTTEERLNALGGSVGANMDQIGNDGKDQIKEENKDCKMDSTHSTSADSGIQSVQGSLRGSSDSMLANDRTRLEDSSTTPKVKHTDLTVNAYCSLVHRIFGGVLETSYTCKTCQSLSLHKEMYTDLHLAVPDEGNLSINGLVTNYFSPETLEGDNQYYCDGCEGLRDAVKIHTIISAPKVLICSLMRFKYDREAGKKSKICRKVDYSQELRLPVGSEESALYDLFAIVIHSGYSSDGGHYYTYARDLQADQWFKFNDSQVSFSSMEALQEVFKTFPRDTGYVLLYRLRQNEEDGSLKARVKRPLRADLRMAVEKDNLEFMRQRERDRSQQLRREWQEKHDKRNGGDGGSGGTNCGMGGGSNDLGGSRFIC